MPRPPRAGPARLTSGYAGAGREARLDALLLQPEVEWLVRGGPAGGQPVLRGFAATPQVRTVDLPGSGPATTRCYDPAGRLVAVVTSPDGRLRAPVVPGGFTVATR